MKVKEFALDFKKTVKPVKAKTQKKETQKKEKGVKPVLKKRETKAGAKEKRGVKFNENIEVHNYHERTWNDYKRRQMVKGAFTPSEVSTLIDSLCSYAAKQDNPEEVLTLLCNKPKAELPLGFYGAWPQIAECLPNRSVQACHNLCRRRFNPDNYQGKWTQGEEDFLRELVAKNGTLWQVIAAEFNRDSGTTRTPTNLKDKWKQMGAENYAARLRGPWSLQEAL